MVRTETLLVTQVYFAALDEKNVGSLTLVFGWLDQLVLGFADGPSDTFGSEFDIVDTGRLRASPRLVAIVDVVNCEVFIEVKTIAVLAQQACTQAVKSTDPDTVAGYELLDPVSHFTSSLSGESDGQNITGSDANLKKVSHSPRDDARFLPAAAPARRMKRPSAWVTALRSTIVRQILKQIGFGRHGNDSFLGVGV